MIIKKHPRQRNQFRTLKTSIEDLKGPPDYERDSIRYSLKKLKHLQECPSRKNSILPAFNPSSNMVERPLRIKRKAIEEGSYKFLEESPDRESKAVMRKRYSTYSYVMDQAKGKGTFGIVYKARVKETGQWVAIKKVFLDRSYKNRELQIMLEIDHPNIVFLRHYYIQESDQKQYLYLVMELMPDTLISIIKYFSRRRQSVPLHLIKLYSYQMLKALAYIHKKGICHRDIKPHNILADRQTGRILLCDFGSAKRLSPDQPNIAYICSRCYRAPELILGCRNYTTAVDIWSVGCVIAEMVIGDAIFISNNNFGMILSIAKIIGQPTRSDIQSMNPCAKVQMMTKGGSKSLNQVLRRSDSQLIDLVSRMLVYNPQERISSVGALEHGFFKGELFR